MSINQLHIDFCEFISDLSRHTATSFNLFAHSFFFDDFTFPTNVTVDDLLSQRLPFPEFWITFKTPLVEGGTLVMNIWDTVGSGEIGLALYQRFPKSRRWAYLALSEQTPEALDLAFLLADACVWLINRQTDRMLEEPRCLIAANRSRAKSKRSLQPLPGFITIRPQVIRDGYVGSGVCEARAKSPHDRRGHWRTYRTGNRVWIRNSAIHGGSYVPRDYRVLP